MEPKEITNRFQYHPPDEAKKIAHETMRSACLSLAEALNAALPEGREKSLAVTHLEEVMFWANAAIARRTNSTT